MFSWWVSVGWWARANFGAAAQAFLLIVNAVSVIVKHAMPIVSELDVYKGLWVGDEGDYDRLVDVVKRVAPDEDAEYVATLAYDPESVSKTLFNAAVVLLRSKAPEANTPLLNLSVELAYNILVIMKG